MILTMLVNPTASISGSTTICENIDSDITFNATPNTTITYNINGGSSLTIAIDGTGTETINSGSLTNTTIYNLDCWSENRETENELTNTLINRD